jgi:hypothetical protein
MSREETMSDYVWDGSGPRDEDVARLESLLSGQRHSGRAPELVVDRGLVEAEPVVRVSVKPVAGPRRWLAMAAAVVLVAAAGWLARVGQAPATTGVSFALDEFTGMPRVGSMVAQKSPRLGVGEWLQTDAVSSARIEVADIGHVTVLPSSRVQLKSTGQNRHVLQLAVGRIDATIVAPARVFLVDIPAARAVDMGCQYSLNVSQDGSGLLRVTLGHVILEGKGFESDVVMFASCQTRAGVGPGTPYFDDASPRFVSELEKFDFDGGGAKSLAAVIAAAREKDALSLFHLFKRLRGEDKEAVFRKLVALKPLPESVTKEEIFSGNEAALLKWWGHMRPF